MTLASYQTRFRQITCTRVVHLERAAKLFIQACSQLRARSALSALNGQICGFHVTHQDQRTRFRLILRCTGYLSMTTASHAHNTRIQPPQAQPYRTLVCRRTWSWKQKETHESRETKSACGVSHGTTRHAAAAGRSGTGPRRMARLLLGRGARAARTRGCRRAQEQAARCRRLETVASAWAGPRHCMSGCARPVGRDLDPRSHTRTTPRQITRAYMRSGLGLGLRQAHHT